MKRIIVAIITVILVLLLINLMVDNFTYGKFVVKQIESGFKGEITDIFSSGDMVEPTFLRIRTSTSDLELSVGQDILKFSSIGDSIIKLENENILSIKKRDGHEKSFYLYEISDELRNHRNFPKKWKDKWVSPLNN